MPRGAPAGNRNNRNEKSNRSKDRIDFVDDGVSQKSSAAALNVSVPTVANMPAGGDGSNQHKRANQSKDRIALVDDGVSQKSAAASASILDDPRRSVSQTDVIVIMIHRPTCS